MFFKISKLLISLILFFCLDVISAEQANYVKSVTISLEALNKNTIKLEYVFSGYQRSVSLFNPYQELTNEIRKDWTPLNNCGDISDKGILTLAEHCLSASFSVPIKTDDVDGGYPSAYPFGSQGVMLHTGVFAISDDCCEATWKFGTPHGAVIIDGTNRGKKATVIQSKEKWIAFTSVFLSSTPQRKTPSVITNGNVPRWFTKLMLEGTSRITSYYRLTYPQLNFSQPTLFISNTLDDNKTSYHADVSSPRMIMFGFYNIGAQYDQIISDIAQRMLAHEFAHVLQPNLESPAFVHEGGAEFVRWIAEYKLGWIDRVAFGSQFSNALYECLNFAAGRSWKSFANENLEQSIAAYRCGMVLHAIALASSKNSMGSEESVHHYYKSWRDKKDLNFVDGIACSENERCSLWLTNVLSGDEPFSTYVEHQLTSLGIVTGRRYSPPDILATDLSEKALSHLLEENCKNYTYQVSPDNSYLEITSADCETIKAGLQIVNVEETSYLANAIQAIDNQNNGCKNNQKVTLRTVNNELVKVKCSKPFIPPQNYYQIDAEKLFSFLTKKRA